MKYAKHSCPINSTQHTLVTRRQYPYFERGAKMGNKSKWKRKALKIAQMKNWAYLKSKRRERRRCLQHVFQHERKNDRRRPKPFKRVGKGVREYPYNALIVEEAKIHRFQSSGKKAKT